MVTKLRFDLTTIFGGVIVRFWRYREIVRMSNLNEITSAIKTLVSAGTPKKNISVLHCTSEYPTAFKNANLNTIKFFISALLLLIYPEAYRA